MKLNGFVGKGTGKLGSSVFAVSGGEQIVRQYNPNVSNPSTDAQVQQRAKLKLMSQVAAALASIIAFKKQGLVSARNQFISAVIPYVTYENNAAKLAMGDITLTGSAIAFPEITATAGAGNVATVSLASAAAENVDAVLYAAVKESEDGRLEVVTTSLVTTAGAGRTFEGSLQGITDDVWVYGYGLIGINNAAAIRYEDYVVNGTQNNATLDVVRSIIQTAGSKTKTSNVKLTV